jgi:hypothetical protein
VNWGSAAFDPVHQILYANTTYAIHVVKLIPRARANAMKPEPGEDFGPQIGAPFAIKRVVALSKVGMLCNKPPWGTLVALAPSLWSRTIDRPGGRFLSGVVAALFLIVVLALSVWGWRRRLRKI